MSRILPLFVLAVFGCAPYAQVQMQLVEQVDRGIRRLESSLENKTHIVRAYHALQRKQLDDAFDADVQQRDPLTSDWVIEHRIAYAKAIDVLHDVRIASLRADESDQRTMLAMREALERLRLLQSLPSQLTSFSKEPKHEHDQPPR